MSRTQRVTEEAVEDAALRIARHANPELDTEKCIAELEAIAKRVKKRVGTETSPQRQAEILTEILSGEYGFQGNTNEYYDPRNSYLDHVLHRRTGIPITLAVVWIAVGRGAGLDVEGVGFPGHFLARVGGEDGVFVDPFDHGKVLTRKGLEGLAARFLGDASLLAEEHLAPVDTATMEVRMLINLQYVHRRRGDFANAMLAVDRLVDLTDAPEHRRDRGLLAIALGSYATAAEDIEAYLLARPTANDVPTLEVALEGVLGQIDGNLQ